MHCTLAGAQRDCRRANPRMSQFPAISGFFFLDTEQERFG
jgi:hypothetical protein